MAFVAEKPATVGKSCVSRNSMNYVVDDQRNG